jgi:hypothetical protein
MLLILFISLIGVLAHEKEGAEKGGDRVVATLRIRVSKF